MWFNYEYYEFLVVFTERHLLLVTLALCELFFLAAPQKMILTCLKFISAESGVAREPLELGR